MAKNFLANDKKKLWGQVSGMDVNCEEAAN